VPEAPYCVTKAIAIFSLSPMFTNHYYKIPALS
jgi:hypothetical protein